MPTAASSPAVSSDRETLTDPISLELFEDPVQTPCCGNTLSRSSLKKALPRCPLCRVDVGMAHPSYNVDDVPTNRAIAHLVDAYRSQQKCLDLASAAVDITEGGGDAAADITADGGDAAAVPPIGTHVLINGLKAKPEFNGTIGVVVSSYSAANGRVGVKTSSGATLALKLDVLTACSSKPTRREKAEKKAEERAQTRERVGGGLATLRESAAAADRNDSLDDIDDASSLSEAGTGGAAPAKGPPHGGDGQQLLEAVVEGLVQERLWAFSDAPLYDRLLLASRRSSDIKMPGMYAPLQSPRLARRCVCVSLMNSRMHACPQVPRARR